MREWRGQRKDNVAMTDLDGNFSIKAAPGRSFTVSMMGYKDYVMGLEPGNCYPDGRDVTRASPKSSPCSFFASLSASENISSTSPSRTGAVSC